MILQTIFQFLSGESSITDLVSARIYPTVFPMGSILPAIVTKVVSVDRTISHGGFSGVLKPRVQFTCMADDFDSADELKEALIAVLEDTDNWGTWGTTPVYSVVIQTYYDLGYVEDTESYQIAVDAAIQMGA